MYTTPPCLGKRNFNKMCTLNVCVRRWARDGSESYGYSQIACV